MATATEERKKTTLGFPSKPILVEIDQPDNRSALLPWNQLRLRGRWSNSRTHSKIWSEKWEHMNALPEQPGAYIFLDCKERKIRVYDPLNEDKELGEVFDEAIRQGAGSRDAALRRQEEFVQERLTDDDLKTLLHWISRQRYERRTAVNRQEGNFKHESRVTPRNGTKIPTVAEVENMPGMKQINQFDNSSTAPRLEGDRDAHSPYTFQETMNTLSETMQKIGDRLVQNNPDKK